MLIFNRKVVAPNAVPTEVESTASPTKPAATADQPVAVVKSTPAAGTPPVEAPKTAAPATSPETADSTQEVGHFHLGTNMRAGDH